MARQFIPLAVVAALMLASAAPAMAEPPPTPTPKHQAMDKPAQSPWYKEIPAAEACWGDSSERDADLNEGSRITTEEILRILNPAQS